MDDTSFQKQLSTALKDKRSLNAPAGFSARVVLAVRASRQFSRKKVWLGLIGESVSAGLLVLSSWLLIRAASDMGTASFLSLLFTDFRSVTADWQDFAYSFLEALPVWETLLVLVSIGGVSLGGGLLAQVFRSTHHLKKARTIWA